MASGGGSSPLACLALGAADAVLHATLHQAALRVPSVTHFVFLARGTAHAPPRPPLVPAPSAYLTPYSTGRYDTFTFF